MTRRIVSDASAILIVEDDPKLGAVGWQDLLESFNTQRLTPNVVTITAASGSISTPEELRQALESTL